MNFALAVAISLGVDIVDQYSTQEVGYIALQRPDGPGLYVMADTQ